jgi:hypothetical protein
MFARFDKLRIRCVCYALMPSINLYVTKADYPAVKRLARILKVQRMSVSEWFVRQILERLEKERSDAAK